MQHYKLEAKSNNKIIIEKIECIYESQNYSSEQEITDEVS